MIVNCVNFIRQCSLKRKVTELSISSVRRLVKHTGTMCIGLVLLIPILVLVAGYAADYRFVRARTNLMAAAVAIVIGKTPVDEVSAKSKAGGSLTEFDKLMQEEHFEFRLFGSDGTLLRGSEDRHQYLAISYRAPVIVSGTTVGSVELAHSLEHDSYIYIATLVVSVGLAVLIFVFLRVLPLRAYDNLVSELQQEKARLRYTLQHVDIGIAFYDQNERVVLTNDKYYELFDLDPRGFETGVTLKDVIRARIRVGSCQSKDVEDFFANREKRHNVTPASASHQYVNSTKGGRTIVTTVFHLPHDTWISTNCDVTEQVSHEAEIVKLAFHDSVTNLPNRAAFLDRVANALKSASGDLMVALIILDLDSFKDVNDTYGHPAGDELLIAVARRLQDNCNSTEFVARLGGDEFAILKTEIIESAEIAECASRFVDCLKEGFVIDSHKVTIGASAGIVTTSYARSSQELLKIADIALYEAKAQNHGSFVIYDHHLEQRSRERLILKSDLRNAVRNSEIQNHYQPIYRLETDEVIGVEVLLRWTHRAYGNVPPSSFIPLAEESEDIIAISEWSIRDACRVAARWPRPVYVTFNISSVQFRRPGLVDLFLSAVAENGLDPTRVQVELTESVFLSATDKVLSELDRLRRLGIKISLDDFGTGYSSLSQICDLPLNIIKIDKSFVSRIVDSDRHRKIVEAIVVIAESMGMTTIAEGVETTEQLDLLRKLGVKNIQGYLIAKPMARKDVERFLFGKDLLPENVDAQLMSAPRLLQLPILAGKQQQLPAATEIAHLHEKLVTA